jgi:hypothetical protein
MYILLGFIYQNIITMHGPMNIKVTKFVLASGYQTVNSVSDDCSASIFRDEYSKLLSSLI